MRYHSPSFLDKYGHYLAFFSISTVTGTLLISNNHTSISFVCFFFIYSVSCSVTSDSLKPHELQPTRLLCPWNSPGKNTGVDCHSPLQEIFPTQGLNPGLLHHKQILYHLSHQGSPMRMQMYITDWRQAINEIL